MRILGVHDSKKGNRKYDELRHMLPDPDMTLLAQKFMLRTR